MRHFAAIGEAMLELSPQQERQFTLGFAGDTINVATYLARQLLHTQVQVHYATALGNDPYSDLMLHDWRQEKINTELVIRLPNKLPGLYLIRLDDKGERAFYFYRSQSAARELFKGAHVADLCSALCAMDYLYLSCISLAILDPASREQLYALLENAKKQGAKIIFDTNYRPALWPDLTTTQTAIQKIAPYIDIILPTLPDEIAMFNDASPAACAARYHAWGIKEVVIKCDKQPCLVSTPTGQEFIAAESVAKVIDSTGAGDSFNAGYLAARLQDFSPPEAARVGHRLASAVIGHRGAIIPAAMMPTLF
jgi:2-dehydro-3-deoxygluconokinase